MPGDKQLEFEIFQISLLTKPETSSSSRCRTVIADGSSWVNSFCNKIADFLTSMKIGKFAKAIISHAETGAYEVL